MLFEGIKKLVQYGIDTGLIPRSEKIYTTNQLLSLFQEENYEDCLLYTSTMESTDKATTIIHWSTDSVVN